MCKLCENKLDYAKIEEDWLYLEDESLPNAVIAFPCHYCPWCGVKTSRGSFDFGRMMPKITPHDWKEQMREQEAENE